ncbi:bacterial regulatory s, tetR family protein [Mycobacterium intracellulare 1956]|uniref:Bacterial regulatory s, tetR family protein n=1 Tax=Mycobacterium intracellulare 1956 TaxID=1299331 RepID=X8CQ46_MYCIT|nr:bacterial regulatory s, tetR family protein [Mycobacterium intracellulare 1956]
MAAPEGKLKAGRRPNRRGEASRKRVLDVALRLLASGGPEAVSVKLIAKEADVTWGTVQYQFGDADGFWAAAILHILDTAGPRVWAHPLAGSVEGRVAEVIDLLWKAFDSPYNAVVTNLRASLAKDRIELERSYPRTAEALDALEDNWLKQFREFFDGVTVDPGTPAKSARCCPQRFGASTPSVVSGRTSISMTPLPAFARRSPFT